MTNTAYDVARHALGGELHVDESKVREARDRLNDTQNKGLTRREILALVEQARELLREALGCVK